MAADTLPPSIASLVTELLHDMGQPLTTLQACSLLPHLPSGDRDALAAEMAGQVARMTELYRELRLLLAAAMPASAEPVKLLDLNASLRGAEAEWGRQAKRQHVSLLLHLPPESEPGTEVTPQTEQAIRSAFMAALASAPAGSDLRVSVAALPRSDYSPPAVTLAVFCDQCIPEPAAASPTQAGVGLRVAQALLVAEGGRMVYKLQPFRVTIELPGTGTLSAR